MTCLPPARFKRHRAARVPSLTPHRRFRQSSLLIVGCGDVGQRVARFLPAHWRVLALTSAPSRCDSLRAQGLLPLVGNLDQPTSLRRLAALAPWVLHLAPPPTQPATGQDDPRTRHLLHSLSRAARCHTLVYGSTTGVYGDAQGARFDETQPLRPQNARAHRRVCAEQQIRDWGGRSRTLPAAHLSSQPGLGVKISVLRIPGIYAVDRVGGHPRERLARGTPVLSAQDDVYTNHIHADDLARVCIAALLRGRPGRVYHASDDTELKMGDYFDLAADLCGLPRPPRITRAEAQTQLPPMLLSFMSESRRLDNRRMKQELRVRLRYPNVEVGLSAG